MATYGVKNNPAAQPSKAWDDHIFMTMTCKKKNHQRNYTIRLIFPGDDSMSEAHLFGDDYTAAENLRRWLLRTGDVLYVPYTMLVEIVERRRALDADGAA